MRTATAHGSTQGCGADYRPAYYCRGEERDGGISVCGSLETGTDGLFERGGRFIGGWGLRGVGLFGGMLLVRKIVLLELDVG